jgi:peroxiredoxin
LSTSVRPASRRRWLSTILKLAWLIMAASLVLPTGCHSHIPVTGDDAGYAPVLAPPLRQQVPGVGTSVGYLAPDFKLVNVKGEEVRLSDSRGKPVLLNFWTYCDICKEELPYIQSVYDNRGSMFPDLVVLAVNVSQPADQVEEFVSYYGYTFEFLVDTWATVASDYYIHEIPTTFFIDRNGVIQDIQVGLMKGPEIINQRLAALAGR